MRKTDYLSHILNRSNDSSMCSKYIDKLALMDKVINVCKKRKIFNKKGILKAKQEVLKLHIIDCLYGGRIIYDKDTVLLDLLEYIKISGLIKRGRDEVEEFLDAFLNGDKDIADLKKNADQSIKYVKKHTSEERIIKIYEYLGVFDQLKIYIMDPRVEARDKDSSACMRYCRKKARELEMELCRILWNPDNTMILEPIMKIPEIGNFLAYLAFVKNRYKSPMETEPEDLNYYYYEDKEVGWVAEFEDVAWTAVGDTKEEAIANLVLTWRHAENRPDFVWMEINKEFSNKIDYLSLVKEKCTKEGEDNE